ncbi:hypothetical protein Tco_0376568, partial [Tanacetum coccineum]
TEEGNVLRYELNDMKGKYTSACSSYTHIAKELEKSRQQETSIGKMVLLFSDENERMKQELMREAQGPSLSMTADGGNVDLDPSMMEKIAQAVAGLKKETWACMDTIIKALELSYALLRYVLRYVLR